MIKHISVGLINQWHAHFCVRIAKVIVINVMRFKVNGRIKIKLSVKPHDVMQFNVSANSNQKIVSM